MKKYFNIGCGFTCGESFENFDASPTLRIERLPLVGQLVKKNAERFPDLAQYGDITKEPLCPDGAAGAIFCSHMLEHVPYDDMRRALKNMNRMLETGGILRVIVPDLWARAREYMAAYDAGSPDAAGKFMEKSFLGMRGRGGLKGRIFSMFGNSSHLWMYDRHSMTQELKDAGFRNIRECAFGDSPIAAFKEVENIDRFDDHGIVEVALECVK